MNKSNPRRKLATVASIALVLGGSGMYWLLGPDPLVRIAMVAHDPNPESRNTGSARQPAAAPTPERSTALHNRAGEGLAELQARLRELAEQNTSLQAEMRHLRSDQDRVAAQVALGSDENMAEDEPEVDPDVAQEQAEAEALWFYEQQMLRLEEEISGGADNPELTERAWADVAPAFESNADYFVLDDLSCAGTACRVQARLRPTDDVDGFVPPIDHVVHGEARWPGQSLFEMDMESGEVVVYLMQEGVEMPQIAAP